MFHLIILVMVKSTWRVTDRQENSPYPALSLSECQEKNRFISQKEINQNDTLSRYTFFLDSLILLSDVSIVTQIIHFFLSVQYHLSQNDQMKNNANVKNIFCLLCYY